MKMLELKEKGREVLLLTGSTLFIAVGVYFFKFPNNFTFGGVTGLAVLLAPLLPISASTINFIINMILLLLGFLFLGRDFGLKTAYTSVVLSVSLSAMEYIFPLEAPLTNQPMLDLCSAVALPAVGSAILFNIGASSGGTDIVAMILKKYTSFNIGSALLYTDLLVTLCSFVVFDVQTGLFSFVGLTVKSLVIDNVIESINLCKYFNIICDEPEPIIDFIVKKLHRGATVCTAEGAYTHGKKAIIFTALRRPQALALRRYVKSVEPTAFILITNTSEIIGKGFQK